MAPILGARQLIDIAVPTGVDATEILRFQMESGMTGEEAVAMAANAIGNENEATIGRIGGLIYITESNYARYRQGESTRSMTPLESEDAINDPVRSAQIGHMLPRHDYSDTLAWSKRYLKRADRDLMRFDLDLVVERWRNRVSYDFWKRVLTDDENAIGDAGYDVGWAIGTGTNVNFIPPQYEGNLFASSHSHYNYYDSASITWAAAVTASMAELREHGHLGTLALFISAADVSAFQSSNANFSKLTQSNIIFVGGNTSAPVRYSAGTIEGMPGELIGYFDCEWGQAEVRYHERIPTEYAFLSKSYGVNNPRNGVSLRAEVGEGFGMKVEPQLDTSVERQLAYLQLKAAHGIGINDRTNGVAIYRHSGAASWADATIS